MVLNSVIIRALNQRASLIQGLTPLEISVNFFLVRVSSPICCSGCGNSCSSDIGIDVVTLALDWHAKMILNVDTIFVRPLVFRTHDIV